MRSLSSDNRSLSFANRLGIPQMAQTHRPLHLLQLLLHILSPIQRSLQGASAPPAPPAFEPQCLLTIPGCPNSWLTTHLPNSLRQATVTTWFNKSQSSTGTEEYHPVQHGQSGCMVERPTTWRCGHRSKGGHHDGHSAQPSSEEL